MNSKKFNIVINGKSYEILIGDVNSSPVSVFVDGVEYKVDLKENKNKNSQTQEENIPTKKPKIQDKNVSKVSSHNINDGTVRAPMPGVILEVKVAVNDKVNEGDILMILESMKMENTIKSSRDGTVESIYISQGDSVQHGQSLIEIK